MRIKHSRVLKCIGLAAVVLIILGILPLAIDKWVLGNEYISNIDNSDWSSFLGSYIGAILGGIVTLLGVGITIWYQHKQITEDRRLSIAPYMIYNTYNEYSDSAKKRLTQKNMALYYYRHNSNLHIDYYIELKNVGMGPALDIEIYDIFINGEEVKKLNDDNSSKLNDEILDKKSDVLISINLRLRLDNREEEQSYCSIERKETLSFKVRYYDLLENQYKQDIEVCFGGSFGYIQFEKKWHNSHPEFEITKKSPIIVLNRRK